MSIKYPRGDGFPAWTVEIDVDPSEDFGVGWTFALSLSMHGEATKTADAGIIGAPNLVTVFWETSDLDLVAGEWEAKLRCTRTVDDVTLTITESLIIE